MSTIFRTSSALGVVLVQCTAIDCLALDDVRKNIQKLAENMDRSARAYPEADLIVFPECSTQGAHPTPDTNIFFDIPNEYTEVLSQKCRELKLWGVFNFLEKSNVPGRAYNATVLMNNEGRIALKQRKLNPFVPLEGAIPGDTLDVCSGPKDSVFGIMTCYDGDLPEVARELSSRGANVLLRPSCYMEPYSDQWCFVNQTRSYENLAFNVAVNRVGTSHVFTWFGSSLVTDYVGRIMHQAPRGIECLTKVDIYPALANEARKEYRTCNHLYNVKHRGYVGLPPDGDQRNIYSFYSTWRS